MDNQKQASATKRYTRSGRVKHKSLQNLELKLLRKGLRTLKRVLVLIVGGTILLIGILMIVLPGPAFAVIPLGLAVLAIEFRWARRLLKEARTLVQSAPNKATNFKKRCKLLLKRLVYMPSRLRRPRM